MKQQPAGEVVVDLAAIRHNLARIRDATRSTDGDGPAIMAVVKADAYGHGMAQVAAAARAAGAEWIGVATIDEALTLRAAGDEGRLMCWLAVPGTDFAAALAAGIDVTATSVTQLDEIVAAARRAGVTARIHLMVDTGMSRDGSSTQEWPALTAAAARAAADGHATIAGICSHLACADSPDDPANQAQEEAFRAALDVAARAGVQPEVRHLANSAGALLRPTVRFDLIRIGIAMYGFSPAPDVHDAAHWDLRSAMTVTARLAAVRDIPAGAGVSYGHTFRSDHPMRVGLVPFGYGDGIPRHGSGVLDVFLGGRRRAVLGRICMDQFVVEAEGAEPGDTVVLFGPGQAGEPTGQEWADRCGTISYEIVTRMGGRQQRVWVGDDPA